MRRTQHFITVLPHEWWQNSGKWLCPGFTGWSKLKERVLQYDFMIIDRKFYFYPLFNWLRNIKNFIYSVSSRSNNEFCGPLCPGRIEGKKWGKRGKCGKKSVKKCDRMVGEDDRIEIYPLTEILPPWLFWISLYEVRGSFGSIPLLPVLWAFLSILSQTGACPDGRWWAHELLISLDYGKRMERKELWDDENRLLDAIYLWFLDCH